MLQWPYFSIADLFAVVVVWTPSNWALSRCISLLVHRPIKCRSSHSALLVGLECEQVSQAAQALHSVLLQQGVAAELSLRQGLVVAKINPHWVNTLDAMLIARNTLSQFASTHATASVPSRSVASLASNAPI
jgi:hypothetical protein